MCRVIGIDPGTVTVDLCGLDDGQLFLDQSLPTSRALADPAILVSLLEASRPLDLVAGPSGYGLPLIAASDLTDADLRLAYLAAEGEAGGIGGLRSLIRALARASIPVVLTPGVVHLPSVPAHRKVNRVDMGTADKVCAVALGIREQARRRACPERDVSFILLELGGAFSAAIAVHEGRIVDGAGGSSGPLGIRAAGALDAEVAYLAGDMTKALVFTGGAATIAGMPNAPAEALATPATPQGLLAWDAYLESAAKAVAAMSVAVPQVPDVILSGRMAHVPGICDALSERLLGVIPGMAVQLLQGFAPVSKQAAQGAALIADGLAGGGCARLVDRLGIRDASGTVLDHLYVISPAAARARLGIAGYGG